MAALLALLPASAAANMASPTAPGDLVGEPSGELAQMHVEHERLSIDLRPLETSERAGVEATYRIRNDGPETTVDLVFVATGLSLPGAGVWLDGQAIDSRLADEPLELPWRAPDTTPGLGGRALPYDHVEDGQLLFSPTIGSGVHEVTVRYTAAASAYSGASPVRFWQLGYVLSPARAWASFGTLDVALQLPAGWSAATEPSLQRSGDELTGTFEGVPADALAITAQAPVPAGQGLSLLVTLAAVVVIGLLIARAGGRFLGRRARSSGWLLPISVAYALIGAVAVAIAGMAAVSGGGIPVAQRAWTYGYGGSILVVLSFPLVLLGLVVIMQLAAALFGRRVRRPVAG